MSDEIQRATVNVDGERITGRVYHVRENGWPCVETEAGRIASGPAVNPRTRGRIRAELLQNGLVRVFDYASGLTATGWPDGRHHGGPVSLWQTWEQNGRERTPWAPAS
jgi:hypothetical protein